MYAINLRSKLTRSTSELHHAIRRLDLNLGLKESTNEKGVEFKTFYSKNFTNKNHRRFTFDWNACQR